MMDHLYAIMQSPLGDIVLTSSEEALTGVYTPEHAYYATAKNYPYNPAPFQEAFKQLSEYFEGKRYEFDLPLAPIGTNFQQRIWKALCDIPYGKITSYGALAKSLNIPKALRAIGTANSKNPLSIIVPCHRVIGSNGRLSGYAGGIKTKAWLLKHETKNYKNGGANWNRPI